MKTRGTVTAGLAVLVLTSCGASPSQDQDTDLRSADATSSSTPTAPEPTTEDEGQTPTETPEPSTEPTAAADDMSHPEVLEGWERGEYDPAVLMNATDEKYVELLKAQAPDAFEYMEPDEIVRKAVGVCKAASTKFPSSGYEWKSRNDAYEGSRFAEGIDDEVNFMVDKAFEYYCPESGARLT